MHGFRIEAALRGMLGVTLSVLALLWALPASAHKASDAYLQWRQEGQLVALRWDVAVRDLQALMPLDSDDDGRITWGELKVHQAEIDAYMLSHVRLRMASQVDSAPASAKKADGVAQTCHLRPVHTQGRALDAAPLERRGDGAYYVLRLNATCTPASRALQVSYRFMQEVDPTHRGLLSRQGGSDGPVSLVPDGRWVTVQQTPARLSMMDTPSRSGLTLADSPLRRASYVPEIAVTPAALPLGVAAVAEAAEPPSRWQLLRDGVHHILIGTDHVLFLICLLLPAVLVRKIGPSGIAALAPVPHARQALAPVLGAVTMFTIAHSITLGLAGLGWVHLSPRVVEPGIALTIALAAIDNVKPIFQGRRHLFTFLFGLVHGFGFAGVLAELNLPTSGFAWALLEFNVGVELGQLLVLVPAMAVLLPMRHWKAYPRQFMPAASLVALLVALGWWVERVFDLGFMPI